MQSKSTTKPAIPQQIIAGIFKNDTSIEFFGLKKTKQVFWLQNGHTHPFSELKDEAAKLVVQAYEEDTTAKSILHEMKGPDGEYLTYARKLELYVYYCYGSLDTAPDIKDGTLGNSENFRHKTDCISLNFERKKLRLNGHVLKPREIKMLDLFATDTKDFVVADELKIAVSTFNQHKREFFKKTGVLTKTALMIAATQQNLVL